MMKRMVALCLTCALLLTGCGQKASDASSTISQTPEASTVTEQTTEQASSAEQAVSETEDPAALLKDDSELTQEFLSMSDPRLLEYIEYNIYTGLADQFDNEDYVIENVNAVYFSEDYLEEKAYNSKSNIFFGYTLAELDEQFQGMPYVFTLGNDGKTTVVPFEDYDDTYDQVIKSVAVGTGVILVCVTVSVVTGGVGATAVSMVFAAAAKTGTTVALSSGAFSSIFAGAVTGIQTKDFDQALKVAALEGSNGFKWGAITGAIAGGVSAASNLRKAATAANDTTQNLTIIEKAQKAEARALQAYGGEEQVSFLGGKRVPATTKGATRPDILRTVGDHLEAIEVKYYNLESSNSVTTLCAELKRQVSSRLVNLPEGTTQRIVLDVTDRGFNESTANAAVSLVRQALADVYPNIPIDIVGLM